MSAEFDYDINNKILTICGKNENEIYTSYIESKINSETGLIQTVELKNNNETYPIGIKYIRSMNSDFSMNDELEVSEFTNINVWKYKNEEVVEFLLENKKYRTNLKALYTGITDYWDKIDITQTAKSDIYKLKLPNNLLKTLCKLLQTNTKQIITLREQLIIEKNEIEYVILTNDFMYFVLECIGEETVNIYDWNIISLPKFSVYHAPIFNVTLPNAHLVYGFAINSYTTNLV